ncbi:MAG: UDP-N-acetylglucosamine 2-epimerase, partial [Gaiellaceae bacterium]
IAEKRAAARDGAYTALTIHRQANTEPERLREIAVALSDADRRFVFPVHPRTRHALAANDIPLPPNVEAIEPLGYLEMLALVEGAELVVTDSGGLQKEAYWLRVPCVTLRPNTEWVDTVASGANALAEPDGLAAAMAGARFPENAPPLYGDGHAAERIAASLYS